jgi:hypothetical protein
MPIGPSDASISSVAPGRGHGYPGEMDRGVVVGKRGLRREAIVVLDPTENRERDEPACSRRRLLQLGVRIRDSVDRLRRPGPVVIPDVLPDHAANVVDAEEYEVIQRLLPQRPHEALDIRGSVRRSVRDGQSLDPDDFVQPTIEMATVAALSPVFLNRHVPAELPKMPSLSWTRKRGV